MLSKEYKFDVTVIIPTHNRAAILDECLEKLINQNYPKKAYEIIVVDDGSSDDTKNIVEKKVKKALVSIKYIYQKKQGQGIARNLGLRYAKGQIIIFIGDDILVLNDFLKQHIRVHTKFPGKNAAVLGFIAWDPRIEITPFMDWLTNGSSVLGRFGGHQFAFEKLKGKKAADYNFFYTSNVSLKAVLLKKHPFDSRFSSYGWEDIELGYRLTKKEGLVLHYNPSAIAYHFHEIDENSLKQRMVSIGKSAHLLNKKYPELKKVPSLFKRLVFLLLYNPLSLLLFKKTSRTLYYYALSKKYFMKGINS